LFTTGDLAFQQLIQLLSSTFKVIVIQIDDD